MSKAGISLLILILLALPQPARANTRYEQGLKLYKQGLYKQAALNFSQASMQEPSMQLYHYYLANCLVHLDEHKRAASEYKQAYLLDSTNSTGEFCRQALIAYKKKLPSEKLLDMDLGESSELNRVKEHIRKQASCEAEKHNSALTRSELAIKTQLDEQLRAVDLQMQTDLQKLHEPIIYTPGPQINRLLALPELLKEREDQIKAAAQLEKERIIKETNERTKNFDGLRKDRSALLDETAENLQKQLELPAGRSGVKLQTQGTGLYVRYYGKGGKNYCPDPQQATVRIQDANATKQTDTEETTDVKGKIVKDAAYVNTVAGK